MIEQGRIDYILNADEDEKRFLIEEAAGISKYKVKKEEAIRKLERTEENLLRIRDIIAEVQRKIQYAERQAKRAKKYREVLEALKRLEIGKSFFERQCLENELEALGTDQKQKQDAMSALEQRLREIADEHQALGAVLKEVTAQYSEEEAKRYQIISKIEQHEQQLTFNGEKRLAMATRRGEIQQERAQLGDQIAAAALEIEEKHHGSETLDREIKNTEDALRQARENLEAIESELSEARRMLQEGKGRVFEAAAETSRLRSEVHRLAAAIESSREQKRRQEAGANRHKQEMNEWSAKKTRCEAALSEVQAKLAGSESESAGIDCEIGRGREGVVAIQGQIEDLGRQIHEKMTRIKLLEEIDAAGGATVESMLSSMDGAQRDLIRSLRDIVTVREGYEWAAEAALGSYAHSLVARDKETARKLLQVMNDRNYVPSGILIGEFRSWYEFDVDAQKPDHPDISHALSEVVTAKEGFESILAPLLERVFVAETWSPDHFESLYELADDHIIVTREGTVLGPYGMVFFRKGQISADQSFFKRGQ